MLLKKARVKENALKNAKNAQKANFWAKVIMQYFQKYVRYECKVFWGSKDIPWAHFETIARSPTHPTSKTPTPLVNSCLFWRFLGYFYLQLELGKKLVNIIMLTKFLESATHTYMYLSLKYYHHTTTRSVNFLFSKSLLPNCPL